MNLSDAQIKARIIPEMIDMWTGPMAASLVAHRICSMIGLDATAGNMDRVSAVMESVMDNEGPDGAVPVLDRSVIGHQLFDSSGFFDPGHRKLSTYLPGTLYG